MSMTMEDMLPLVAELTDRYTSKDSSSVTYETARMLMAAVIYCVREWEVSGECLPSVSEEGNHWRMAYQLGYENVVKKTHHAKQIYESILKDFNDYRCQNYQDTIIKGMPAFFMAYDPRFCPQNHILTLDYPTLSMDAKKTGVDLILDYLMGIQIEQEFLNQFEPATIMRLLERINPEYETLYLDNICEVVLLQAVGCVLAGKPVRQLLLDEEDREKIVCCLDADGKEQSRETLRMIIRRLGSGLENPDAGAYLAQSAEDCAVRMARGAICF